MRRKKDKSNGITALYERLSRDDDNAGESNSIVHQKQMLEDYAMKHGFTNNTPSVDELEEKAKRGEVISLSALAAAVKAEDGRTPHRDPDGKKPSIRAQLKADRAQSCKPQQREKEQEAKRSIRQALEME